MEILKFKNFSNTEKKWLEALFNVEFPGKEVVLEQLHNAQVSRDYNVGYISLKFKVDKNIRRFDYGVRVPIEMRVIGNDAPTVFLLHVIEGVVDELEIFNADSSAISRDIQIEKGEVIVNEILRTQMK